ncbi:MAG: M23 family metallopeptidase [Patescibacteria group bacterium]
MKDKSSPVSENVGKLQGKGSVTNSDSESNTFPPIYFLIVILVVALLGFWSYIGRQKIVKFVNKLLALLLFSTFLIGSSKAVSAQSAYTSYKIVDAFIMQGYGGYTSVTNLANIYVTVSSGVSGRFVISRNPDGTGAVNVGNYLNVQVQHTYYSSTQSYWVGPQDTLYTHYNCPDVTTVEPQNISSWFHSEGSYNILFRFITSCYKSFPVSDLYLVFVPNPTATPTATPTNTPTPTPTPFPKFLDLPWDYRSKGLTFNSAATKINSFFDHEYPLLSSKVSGLSDPDLLLTNYEGKRGEFDYSSHDGYDYGAPAKIYLNTPLLATGDGVATYMDINKCGPCGNAVYIDHGNGFQTRYYHMIFDSLYAERNGKEINVKSGDQIGTVGSTGKSSGPHIHFMVIYDKNHDGNFEDNIPDGIIDPYGWEGDVGSDPWENATFQSPYGVNRTGMKSSYLWKYDLFDKKEVLNNKKTEFVGEGLAVNINDMKLTDEESLEFRAKIVPAVGKILAEKKEKASVAFDITVKDPATGQFVRYFNNPFNLIIDLTSDVEEYFKPETLKIHSSDDEGTTWKEEVTEIDWQNKKAIAVINHTTLFAVYGEKKSDEPPNTVMTAKGIGKEAKYRSDVDINIDVSNKDASELRYTLYTLDSEYDWREYLGEFSVASEGAHMIRAFSEDKYGNIEDPKTLSFEIDKTPPEIKVSYATDSADFVFANAENDVALRQAPPYAISYGVAKQDDTNNVVVVEDEAGNTNELTYETYMQDDMHILRILGNKRNGVEIDFQPTIYAIGNDIEYFRSGENGARILRNSSDQRIRVEDDSVTNLYEKSSTLQLVTDGDRLKEDIGNR